MPSFDSRSDDELAEAFRRGESAAMEALYAKYRMEVFGWACASLRDRHEAEDLSQEIWLKAIRSIGLFKGGNFGAWLWRVARHAAIDHSRKRIDKPVLDAPAGDKEDSPTFADLIPDESAVSALEQMEEDERREAVREAISELSEKLREVVLLRVCSGLKFKEIAEMAGLPLGTVLARMNIAMGKLKKILVEKGFGND